MKLKEMEKICSMLSCGSEQERKHWESQAVEAFPEAVKRINFLQSRLIESEALCLHRWRQIDENDKRSWEELSPEEVDAIKSICRSLLEQEIQSMVSGCCDEPE